MRSDRVEQFNAAYGLVLASAADPSVAPANAPEILALLSRLAPEIRGERSAMRLVVPSRKETVTLSNTGSTTTTAIPITFPGRGRVVGIGCTVAEGNQHRTSVSMALERDGENPIVTTGKGGAFVSLALLSGFRRDAIDFFEFPLDINYQEQWTVRFTSERAPLVSGTETFTPLLVFFYEQEPNLSPNRP